MHRKPHPVTLLSAGILATALLVMSCSTAASPALTQSALPQVSGTPQATENLTLRSSRVLSEPGSGSADRSRSASWFQRPAGMSRQEFYRETRP
jgi:hypothetical protein